MPRQPRVALVTGASSGIGAATARRLARDPGTELVLVARRGELLAEFAAALPRPATWIAVDLTDPDVPARVRAQVEAHHDRLDLLVNNAGAAWRGTFAETGYANVHRHTEPNRGAGPTHSPSRRRRTASTSAWSCPASPDRGLPGHRAAPEGGHRLILSTPDKVAEAIVEVGPGGKAERYVPRPYGLAAMLRVLTPRLVRRVLGGGSTQTLTPVAAERRG